jgi:peptide deformylase
MAILKIIRTQIGLQMPPNAPLRQQAAKILKVDKNIRRLLDDMVETLEAAGGLGLAAPQVGFSQRLFIVKNGTVYFKIVNPSITVSEGLQDSPEACLSLPGIYGMVRRPARVIVRALDENGKPFELEGTGRLACVLAHEYDHLEGILFTDKAHVVRHVRTAIPSAP